jgi:beta-phosphoglucomutase
MKKSGFIFDMNGTMIDDMSFHTKVWHRLLTEDLGSSMTYEEVKLQMYGKNGDVLERVFGKERFTQEEMNHLSIEKEKRYQEVYLPHLKLIDGLASFLENAYARHIRMAIGSAAIPFNINFALDNLHIRHYFKAIVSADDVLISKPHPETFLKAAQLIEVAPAGCIVFEDAPKGVEAAHNAGMDCIVLLTAHERKDFMKYSNVIGMVQDYQDPLIIQLLGDH